MKTRFRSLATKASLAALVAGSQLMPIAAYADEYNPGITPKWDNPFTPSFNTVAGTIQAIALGIGVIAFLIAAIVFTVGKMTGRSNMQDNGVAAMIWVVVGVVIVVSVNGIIGFATGQFSI